MDKFYSPLRYPGGKSCIFPFVSKLFYENNLLGMSYAEPYAGGSGLALRLLFEEYVDKIYINDLDRSIFSFWKTVLYRTDDFCDWIETVEVSLKNWAKYKKIQANPIKVSEFELAKSTFFLNRTNMSGIIKGGAIGGLSQKGKYKINARFNKQELIQRIRRVSELRHRIILSNIDGLAFINKMNRKKDDVFIYLDPPYFKKGADLYMNFYKKEDHKKLSKKVGRMEKRWMVSYDNHQFILNLYAENKKVAYKLSQCASNRIGDEIVIFSDKISFKKSILSLNSSVIMK
jgi:DNA adenine methylase